MEFARAGDSGSGDVLTISSGREKARDDKVALKREGVDPYVKGPPLTAARRSGSLPRSSTLIGVKGPEEELEQWQRSIRDVPSLHDKKLQEIPLKRCWRRSRQSGP